MAVCTLYRTGDWNRVSMREILLGFNHEVDVLFFGEIHEKSWVVNCEATLLHRAIKIGAKFLGVELFNYEQQRLIDSWVRGDIGWEELIKKYGRGFNLNVYASLLNLAKEHGLKIVGIMPPRKYASRVVREGLEVIDGIAGSPVKSKDVWVSPKYRKTLLKLFPKSGPMAKLNRESLVLAQAYKDTVLAKIVSEAIKRYGSGVVVAGWAHVEIPGSAPTRLSKISNHRYAVIVSREGRLETVSREIGELAHYLALKEKND